MLKIAKKWPNFVLSGQFWLQSDFFHKASPSIRLRSHWGPTGTKNLSPSPIKNLEKKPRL